MDKSKLKKKAEKELEDIEIEADNTRQIKEVIHELKVHQLELEYQNDELKETQSKLLEMRDKYHILYEFAPVSYFTFDKNGVIINANLQASELLNVERKYLLNKPFLVYLCSESQSDFYEHLRSVIDDQSFKKTELMIKNKKGDKINVLIESNFFKKKNYVQSAIIDVTERINLENKLKSNKKYIESVINSLPDIILKFNKNGKCLDVVNNPENFSFKKSEIIINKNIKKIFEDELAAKFKKKIKASLLNSKLEILNYKLNSLSGANYFEARISPLNEKEVIVLIRDITKERKQKNVIEEYTAELEYKQIELENLYYQLDQEVNKASNIHQRNLDNNPPVLNDYYFGGFYQPAAEMGGDYFERIKIGNKLISYITDVTGHGLDAAMMSSFIKSTINSFINAVEIDKINPENISKFLTEQFLNENYPEEYFICISLIVIDLKSNQMEYLSFGMQDPILLYRKQRKDKGLLKLVNSGLPISPVFAIDNFDFKGDSIKLLPGDTIIFNTDGITESKNEGKYFLEQFEGFFKKNAFLPPAVISKRIINKFAEFNDGSLETKDDITYVIIKKKDKNTAAYNFEIKSKFEAVKKLQVKIYNILPNSVSNDIFAMGVHELVVNAVEHGNQQQQEKKVYIKLLVNEEYSYAVIEDQGPGFNWKQKLNSDFNLDRESDRGRGIMMTYRGCDEFFYNNKGNKAFILKLNDI